MTLNNKSRDGPSSGCTGHQLMAACRKIRAHTSERMPAGGWLREIAMGENWRTTTIVQRHRDRANAPAPL